MIFPDEHQGFDRDYIERRRREGYTGVWRINDMAWRELIGDEFVECDLYTKKLGKVFCHISEVNKFRGAHGMDY